MYFPGICLVGQAGQRNSIIGQLYEVVIWLELYGVVWCRTVPDKIAYDIYILKNNGLQVALD